MDEFLHRIYWGNTVLSYLTAAGGMLLAWIAVKLIRGRLVGLLKNLTKRTNTGFDDLLVSGFEKFAIPYVYLVVNYSIITQLTLSEKVSNVLHAALILVSTYYVIRLIIFLVQGSIIVYMKEKDEPPERIKQLSGILLVGKVMVWLLGIVMLVDNLGYDVTTIITAFGVGGIAIALAAQNILGDLFSYLVIFFDKPFEIGDFIIVGENVGVVEKIGIKTSHVRSLVGHQMVMPNAELVKSVIHNYKRLQRRRIVFSIGVVYYTSPVKLKQIPGMVREIISKHKNASFDRAHLTSFGDFSINYEIVYYVESQDYMVYMDTHHDISVALFEKFEASGIEFAFPTQTLFVNKQTAEVSTSLQ